MLNVVKDLHVSLIRRGSYFENALLPYITHSLLERKLCIDQLLINIWTGDFRVMKNNRYFLSYNDITNYQYILGTPHMHCKMDSQISSDNFLFNF